MKQAEPTTNLLFLPIFPLNNVHKHLPFAHANVAALGEPAGMLDPRAVWGLPVLQTSTTEEAASAVTISCKTDKQSRVKIYCSRKYWYNGIIFLILRLSQVFHPNFIVMYNLLFYIKHTHNKQILLAL